MNRNPSFPSVPVFLLFWLAIGFFLGTLTLLGPVRWWTAWCRGAHLSMHWESAGVFFMIGTLVIGSGFVARLVTNAMESARIAGRIGIAAVVLALAGGTVAAWMHPALMSGSMGAEEQTARFTFGPYPNEMRMRQLKREGYIIVSLLHPAVVPFEPKLLADEKEAAARIGIPLIHVPMLPWVSENTDALTAIRRLAADPSHRYYVHCYLGKDRVQIVRRIVEQSGVPASTESLTTHRSLADMRDLERGRVYRLGKEIYLTGYPTDEEFAGYVVSGEIRHVVALLDPTDADDRDRIERERKLLERYQLPFTLIPIAPNGYQAQRMYDAVNSVRAMPKPVLVHAFFSPSTGRSPWADGFLQAFFSGCPSLAPSMFDDALSNGKADVIAAQVAVGPRPAGAEFRELARRGIVACLHVGSAAAADDASLAKNAGMEWRTADAAMAADLVATGGPWYVYGRDMEKVRDAVEAHFPRPVSLGERASGPQ